MKKLICLLFLTVSIFSQSLESPTLVPANTEFLIRWDVFRDDPGEMYRLYLNGKPFQVYTTNEYTVVAVAVGTNMVTLQAKVFGGIAKGTNVLAMTAFNPFLESDMSDNLYLKALGKPEKPQSLRKP